MIDITLIPHDVKVLAEKWANITRQIDNDLNTGIIKTAASYIPEGEAFREVLVAICGAAITGCKALAAIADNDGVKARFQRLGSALVAIQHNNNKHTISYY